METLGLSRDICIRMQQYSFTNIYLTYILFGMGLRFIDETTMGIKGKLDNCRWLAILSNLCTAISVMVQQQPTWRDA